MATRLWSRPSMSSPGIPATRRKGSTSPHAPAARANATRTSGPSLRNQAHTATASRRPQASGAPISPHAAEGTDGAAWHEGIGERFHLSLPTAKAGGFRFLPTSLGLSRTDGGSNDRRYNIPSLSCLLRRPCRLRSRSRTIRSGPFGRRAGRPAPRGWLSPGARPQERLRNPRPEGRRARPRLGASNVLRAGGLPGATPYVRLPRYCSLTTSWQLKQR